MILHEIGLSNTEKVRTMYFKVKHFRMCSEITKLTAVVRLAQAREFARFVKSCNVSTLDNHSACAHCHQDSAHM